MSGAISAEQKTKKKQRNLVARVYKNQSTPIQKNQYVTIPLNDVLRDYQIEALDKLKTGSILCGGVGSGKSRTALAYYMMKYPGRDLYIITTARKRDTFEWEEEFLNFYISKEDPSRKVVVDSWNNITKYLNISKSFFIFDEQRVVGKGPWVKAFLSIAKHNDWILLSATPGDTWTDYIPVFVANGFYRNRTEFVNQHVVFSPFSKFRKVDHYVATGRLLRLRNKILVNMDFDRATTQCHSNVITDYDFNSYRMIFKDRWNSFTNEPIKTASELCYALRRVVNSDESRIQSVLNIMKEHPKVIIFYNFDYELEMLKKTFTEQKIVFSEWNGHKHQDIPCSNKWAYLVQYTAGCEGWNCVTTDTIIFYSQNYSFKVMTQAAGRIDRMNTPFKNLYYYHLKSRSTIDAAISRAIQNKKKFNEQRFYEGRTNQ